ncbi:uncharacterized protein [Malus domestica]|uniref:uncharacterized protein isoform X2 n=1 Tax=Malus domestica TaxID=3750 RepID=UPI0039765B6E
MKGFWKDLLQKNLSRQWLDGLRYSVFGLGDSGYQKFNLDRRLLDLGATPIVERGLGDDQHPSGTRLLWIRGWHHCGICGIKSIPTTSPMAQTFLFHMKILWRNQRFGFYITTLTRWIHKFHLNQAKLVKMCLPHKKKIKQYRLWESKEGSTIKCNLPPISRGT